MKILIQTPFGEAEINEELELTGMVDQEVFDVIEEVKESIIGTSKIAFLFYELKKLKNQKINSDQELKDLLDSLENDFDEDLIY